MRRIKYIIVLLVLAASAGSCKDWLTVLPENEQTAEEYWETKEQVEAVLGAGYFNLRLCTETFLNWGEIRGNGLSTYPVTTNSEKRLDLEKIANLIIIPKNTWNKWDKVYKVIGLANSVIKYAPEVALRDDSFMPPLMNAMLAEASFLRGLSYFYLVRTFGEVPYITEPYVDDKQSFSVPKSTVNYILGQLTADLEKRLGNAKEKFEEINEENPMNSKGRATRWAIYALLADIYLWQGDYANCERCCTAIFNSNWIGLPAGGIDGEVWFRNFFPGNSNESIFEIQYSNALAQNGPLLEIFGGTGTPTYVASNYSRTILLWNSDPSAPDDLRYNCTLDNSRFGYGAGVRKYLNSTLNTGRIAATENDQNWIIYRMADIYLMRAECRIMLGDFDGAMNIINNSIRSRVNAKPLSPGGNESDMLDILLRERTCEFVGEGKNWFDMLRIARRNKYAYQNKLIDLTLMGSSAANEAIIRSKLSDTNALYLPIHSDELKANGLLHQNPYYLSLGN